MATAVRPSHLALICIAFLHLLARATTAEQVLVHGRTSTTTTTPPHASVLYLASNAPSVTAGGPASSHPLRASISSSGVFFPPHHLDVFTNARANATAPAAAAGTTTTAPAPPCTRSCGVHAREASVDDTLALLEPTGINTTPSKKAVLLNALPLLAIPFLPPPMAALVALSALAVPVRACSAPSAGCPGLTHATCTVYRYIHDNGTVNRAQPFAGLRTTCPHPSCGAGSDNRARSTAYDPFHGYCSVRTLEVEVLPEGKAWRIMPVHLPVADPAAVVAAGGDVCYVELEHMNYREGYYTRCPVRDCRHVPVLCCTEFPHPHDAVAAAVWDWEHPRLTYRDTVGWYTNDTVKPQHEGLEDHDEL